MRKLDIGVVGVGGIFPSHAEAIRQTPGVRIVALCDLDQSLACRRADEFGVPSVTGSWQDLLGHGLDAIFVLTPPAAHREPVVAALRAGIHVYCEKPLAHDLADGRAIRDAAKASKAVCQVGFNNLFEPATRQMWEMARRGDLGRLVRAYDRHGVFRKSVSWSDTGRRDRWRLDQAASGGRMQEFGSHKVNWLIAVGGRVKSLVGRADSVAQPLAERGIDDTNVLLVDFEGPGVGSVEITMTPTMWNDRVAGIVGTQASVEWTGGDRLRLKRKEADATEEPSVLPRVQTRHEHFFRWLREIGDPTACPTPEVSVAGAYHTLEICLGFLESARTGQLVRLPALA